MRTCFTTTFRIVVIWLAGLVASCSGGKKSVIDFSQSSPSGKFEVAIHRTIQGDAVMVGDTNTVTIQYKRTGAAKMVLHYRNGASHPKAVNVHWVGEDRLLVDLTGYTVEGAITKAWFPDPSEQGGGLLVYTDLVVHP